MANDLDIKWVHLEAVLNEFADEFITLARQNLTDNGTNASYGLYDSFEKIIEIGEDWFSVKISFADYGLFVENGRGPGRYPPPDAIRRWVEVKPITPQPDSRGKTPSVEQLTFLISRKIAEEGTEAQPFIAPAKEEALREYEQKIDEAIEEDVMDYIQRAVEDKMKDALR